ncbi:hypothetical protein ISN45_Aa01g037520 [Arabidopsis thaliana x Arabidopsis arenosa]|uniref:Transmembrane protein n=1 Tax=Arabidopsis thaliana x Arabidopsis arenosa TaxID=1240361 RepID=A0A8T2C4J4_9BRAS|nr:hypothetical protein ISN45_Aa01g037520 [Arabidopsis thaliana x Arabidopsis arenosa]
MASNEVQANQFGRQNAAVSDVLAKPLRTCCCDKRWIYQLIIMQVLITGTYVTLYLHLRKNLDDDYHRFVVYLMSLHLLSAIIQIRSTNWFLAAGSFSRVSGITAIFLLLLKISPLIAMNVCLPILLWFGITLIYHLCLMCFGAIVDVDDVEAQLAAQGLP